MLLTVSCRPRYIKSVSVIDLVTLPQVPGRVIGHDRQHPRGGRGVRGADLRGSAVARRGVRRDDRGVLRRAARAAAARAAPGPAEPRQHAAALPGSCIRPGRRRVPGRRRARTWPAALASGASPQPAPGSLTPGDGPHDSYQRRVPPGRTREGERARITEPNLMASDTRRGSRRGAPPCVPRASPPSGPGRPSRPPANLDRAWALPAAPDYPAARAIRSPEPVPAPLGGDDDDAG
jgi:hypothetical protein